jgi:hypothetical protein
VQNGPNATLGALFSRHPWIANLRLSTLFILKIELKSFVLMQFASVDVEGSYKPRKTEGKLRFILSATSALCWSGALGTLRNCGAQVLDVTRQGLNKVVNGKSGIRPEMAIRPSRAFGITAEGWLRM